MTDDLLVGLNRIYAAVDAATEHDLDKFPPAFVGTDSTFGIYQDFMGGLSQADVENLAHSLIANIASFPDHLTRWSRQNEERPRARRL